MSCILQYRGDVECRIIFLKTSLLMAYFFKRMLKHFQTFAVPNQGMTEVYVHKIRALEEELSLARLRHHCQRQTIWPRTSIAWLMEFYGHWIRYTGLCMFLCFLVEKMVLLNHFASWYLHLESEQAWPWGLGSTCESHIGAAGSALAGHFHMKLIDWWLIAWALRMSINATEETCFFMWWMSCVIVYEIVWVATIWEEQALGVLDAACFCELNTSQDFASERRERQVEINEDPFSNHDLQMFFSPT